MSTVHVLVQEQRCLIGAQAYQIPGWVPYLSSLHMLVQEQRCLTGAQAYQIPGWVPCLCVSCVPDTGMPQE